MAARRHRRRAPRARFETFRLSRAERAICTWLRLLRRRIQNELTLAQEAMTGLQASDRPRGNTEPGRPWDALCASATELSRGVAVYEVFCRRRCRNVRPIIPDSRMQSGSSER